MANQGPADRPLLLTVQEAARLAGVSRSHAYAMVQRGCWPAIRLGRSCRVPRGWLENWIAEQVAAWQRAREADEA